MRKFYFVRNWSLKHYNASSFSVLDEKLSITKVECNDEEIIFEPEINVETYNIDVPVKSEIQSDDETMIHSDTSHAMDTANDGDLIPSMSDTEASTPTKTIPKGRRAKKSPKESPESSNKSPKPKRSSTQEKVHQCSKCDKIFNRATHLKRHMATHSDVKPYSCEICDKRFRRVDHLNIHRHHHSSIKPHICDICQVSQKKNYISIREFKSNQFLSRKNNFVQKIFFIICLFVSHP